MIKTPTNSLQNRKIFSLEEWLEWQEKLHFTAIELGLERCKTVAERLNLLTPNSVIINVAGTNGKGSSVKMIASILNHAGYKTGSYTSPHIIRYNERIQINGVEVDDKTICESFVRIDQAREDISLTYFEFGTLAAMDIFNREQLDVIIMEVGLGGRLDAVNCFDADLAIVTPIDLDHQNWLGKDRESIAREKAGILRPGIPVVCTDKNPPVSMVSYANELGSRLYLAGRDFDYEINGNKWNWKHGNIFYENLPAPSLYNDAQIQNASGVLMALTTIADKFKVNEHAIKRSFSEFTINGRLQIVPDSAQIILDVAHNVQSASNLVRNLKKIPVYGKTHLLVGMLKDKDHHSVFSQLNKIADYWHIVSLNQPRGTEVNTLGKALSALQVENETSVYSSVPEALETIRQLVGSEDRIVITGSFLTVAAAIKYLGLQAK